MKKLLTLLLGIAAAAIAACSGGSIPTSGTVNAPPSSAPAASPQTATAHFSITIPAGSRAASGIRPKYISPNTQSVSILVVSVNGSAVSGQNAVIVQTYAGAPNCSSASGGLTCTADVPAFAGNVVFSLSLFSAPNATGYVLGTGVITQNISSGGSSVTVSNDVSISIGGVIENLGVSVSPNQIQMGTRATLAVALVAKDASGATIVGPGTFTSPVQLSTSDTTGSVGFITSTAQTPSATISITSPSTTIELVYNGSSQIAPGPLNVEAQQGTLAGSTQVQVNTMTTPTPSGLPSSTPPPQNATVYVLNQGSNGGTGATITAYPLTANGNVAPARILNLSSSLYAAGFAIGPTGKIFVGYYDTPTFGIDSGNEIDVYAAGASGNASPVARITGESSQNTMIDPGVIYADKNGRIITLATTDVDGQSGGDSIVTYAPTANGAVPPAHAWNFDYNNGGQYFVYAFASGGYYTYGFDEDAAGNLYMGGAMGVLASSDRPQGVWVAPAAFVNGPPLTQPSRYIPDQQHGGSATTIPPNGVGIVQGIVLDSSGSIYESQSNNGTGTINVFQAGASGGATNVAPLRTIAGTALNVAVTGQQTPPQLPLAITGSTLVVANQTTNAALLFSSNANGNVSPAAVIQGPSTLLNNPIGIAIGSSGTAGALKHR